MVICGSCGLESSTPLNFCPNCGASLQPIDGQPREVRKTVTVLFSDICGSTSLGERTDPETLRHVMARYFDAMRAVIELHGGTVEKYIGDAIMAVFGIPALHEDDALRAVRAAAEMRDVLADLNEALNTQQGVRIAARTGINTGHVVAGAPGTGPTLVTGDAVNVAARLEQSAAPGDIVIGPETFRLVRHAVEADPLEPLQLKGKADRVAAYRLSQVTQGAAPTPRRLDSPMVGREDELMMMQQALATVTRERRCHLFTILGHAGAGKSRLVREFLPLLSGAQVFQGRCLSYGHGITYFPAAGAIKQAAGIEDGDTTQEVCLKLDTLFESEAHRGVIRERLLQILGLSDSPATPQENWWAVRKLFERLANDGPVVVVFDDIHWGEPSFLDLIEYLVARSRDAPILLVCVARPELLDQREGWGEKADATTIRLDPLPEAACDLILDNLLGSAEVPERARTRIMRAAEGNPLFIEEMVGMLVDQGHLARRGSSWVATSDLSDLAVPATIQALIAARLDRLDLEERLVVEAAAVVGKVFHFEGVRHLTSAELHPKLSAHLGTLVRKELIRRDHTEMAGNEGFRFRHILIRETAYSSMPKRHRAELHQRFAGWLTSAAGERLTEYEEILGYHYEQAYILRRELGLPSHEDDSLASRAVVHLSSSAHRAFARGDLSAAEDLFRRAVGLEPDPQAVLALQLDLIEALIERGDLEGAEVSLNEINISDLERDGLDTRAQILRLLLEIFLDPEGAGARSRETVEQLIPRLEQAGDDRTLAKAYRLLGVVSNLEARFELMVEASEKAIDHARRAGDLWEESENANWLVQGLWIGPTPGPDAFVRHERIAARYPGSLKLQLSLQQWEGEWRAWQGDFAAGTALVAQARAQMLELGLEAWYLATAMHVGWVALITRYLEEAERPLREAYARLEEIGEKSYLSTIAAILSEVLLDMGDDAEARRFAALSRESAATDDYASQVWWRGVEARVSAHESRFDAAEDLAREAVNFGDQTDSPWMRGDPRRHLGVILEEAGRHEEARNFLEQARAIYERKGIAPRVNELTTLLSQLPY